jgi:hypothetical protein
MNRFMSPQRAPARARMRRRVTSSLLGAFRALANQNQICGTGKSRCSERKEVMSTPSADRA